MPVLIGLFLVNSTVILDFVISRVFLPKMPFYCEQALFNWKCWNFEFGSNGKSKVIVYFVNLNLITIKAIIESLSPIVNTKMYK